MHLFTAILPVFLAFVVLSFIAEKNSAETNEHRLIQSRRALQMIRREADNEAYIQKRLNFMYAMLSEDGVNPENIRAYVEKARLEGLTFVNFRFFDEKAAHLPFKGESDQFRVFIGKIFAALVQPELEGKSTLLASHRSFFEAFLGEVSPATLANEKSALIKAKIKGADGWFYWNTFYSPPENDRFRGGVAAFFADADVPGNFAVRRLIEQAEADSGFTTLFCMLDLDSPNNSVFNLKKFRQSGLEYEELVSLLKQLRNDLSSEKELAGGSLVVLGTDAGRFLIAFNRRVPGFADRFFFLLRLALMVLTVFFLRHGFSMELKPENGGSAPYIWQATMVAMLPLLAIAVYYLGVDRRLGEIELREKLTSYINVIDENYIDEVAALEKNYRLLAARLKKSDSSDAVALTAKLHGQKLFSQVYVIDSTGKVRFSFPQKVVMGEIVKKMLPTIAERLFSRRSSSGDNWRRKINDMMYKTMTDNLGELLGDQEARAGFTQLFEKTDQLIEVSFANRRFFVFSKFLEGEEGQKPELMFLWHESVRFADEYLKKQIARVEFSSMKEYPVRLAARSRVANLAPYPPEFVKYPFGIELYEKVIATEYQHSAVVEKDGSTWLVLASPLKKIPGSIIFAMHPFAVVEQRISRLKKLLLMIFLCSLAYNCCLNARFQKK